MESLTRKISKLGFQREPSEGYREKREGEKQKTNQEAKFKELNYSPRSQTSPLDEPAAL